MDSIRKLALRKSARDKSRIEFQYATVFLRSIGEDDAAKRLTRRYYGVEYKICINFKVKIRIIKI